MRLPSDYSIFLNTGLTSTNASKHILHVSGWSGSGPESDSSSVVTAFLILLASPCAHKRGRVTGGTNSCIRGREGYKSRYRH